LADGKSSSLIPSLTALFAIVMLESECLLHTIQETWHDHLWKFWPGDNDHSQDQHQDQGT
jgi:hypothetical protein